MNGAVIERNDAQYQALKLAAQAAVSSCDRVIKEKQAELEECKKLREAQTCDVIDGRIKALEEVIENLNKEKQLAERRLVIANELIAESEQEVSIQEPYDETQKPSRAAMRRQREQQKVSDDEYKSLMRRLDELAAAETENDEYNEEIASTSKFGSARSMATEVGNAPTPAAANGHVEDDVGRKKAPKKPLPGFKRGWLKYAPKQKQTEPPQNITERAQRDKTTAEITPPKGVSQEDYQRLLEIVEALEASSSSEEELEEVEERDEEQLDEERPKPQEDAEAKTKPKKGVRFSEQLEVEGNSGATTSADKENVPKPILRNKDYVSPVDTAALKEMENRDVARIVPASEEAIKPDIVERVPWQVDPSLTASAFLASENRVSSEGSDETPHDAAPPSQPQKVSRFKAQRMQARR